MPKPSLGVRWIDAQHMGTQRRHQDLKAWSVPSDLRRQVKPRSARGRTAVVEGGLPQPNVVSGNARAASLVELLRHPFIHSMLIHAFLKSSLPPRNHAVPRGFCATVLCDAMETDWLAGVVRLELRNPSGPKSV